MSPLKLHFHFSVSVSLIYKDTLIIFTSPLSKSVTIIFIVVCAVNCSHHEHCQKNTFVRDTTIYRKIQSSYYDMIKAFTRSKPFKRHWHSV